MASLARGAVVSSWTQTPLARNLVGSVEMVFSLSLRIRARSQWIAHVGGTGSNVELMGNPKVPEIPEHHYQSPISATDCVCLTLR